MAMPLVKNPPIFCDVQAISCR